MILRHYVFSPYFLLDVAAVVPLEVFGLAWDPEERYGYVAIFRLNRLIKIWKVGRDSGAFYTVPCKVPDLYLFTSLSASLL